LVERNLALGRPRSAAPPRRHSAAAERQAREEFVAASRDAVERFLDGLRHGRIAAPAITDAERALAQLGADAGLPLLTPELDRLVALAERAGAAAKLSGAGGGDCALALVPDPIAAGRVRAQWRGGGYAVLDLRHGAPGVSVAQA
jgi:phosphomevalonate kinase